MPSGERRFVGLESKGDVGEEAAPTIVDPTKPVALGRERQLRRVMRTQDEPCRFGSSDGCCIVRGEDPRGRYLFVAQEAIRRFELRIVARSIGKACSGIGGEPLCDAHEPLRQTTVAELGSREVIERCHRRALIMGGRAKEGECVAAGM
jgi:hypothetical protein